MEQKKSWFGAIMLGIVLGMIVLFMLVDCFLIPHYIEAHGIQQTVTVSFHEKKGRFKTGYTIVSSGYYYVKGKQYTAFLIGNFPIGTEFEIKYCPKIPKRYEANKNKIIVREQ